MRRLWLCIVALAFWNAPGSLRAGVYQTVEPVAGPAVTREGVEPMPFKFFREDIILGLFQIRVDTLPKNEVRDRYLKHRDELLRKEKTGRATEEDLVNLSAVLIRLGEPGKVIELLRPHARSGNFMLLSNLATAQFLYGQEDRAQLTQASEYLSLALAVWPRESPGLTAEQLRWYQQVEKSFLRLLRSRLSDLKLDKDKRPDGLDPLFWSSDNPVRFVGESGEYEPGKLAAVEAAKLPKDAVATVQQLLIWLPADTRLYWLYGELLNAEGDPRAARDVLDFCTFVRGHSSKELKEHRQILNEAAAESAAATPRKDWVPESSHLIAVGTVAGVVILVLLYFQFREVFRRRAGKG